MRRREQQELFKIANDHPALWLNEFGELSRYLDKRVAKWECQTLANRGQRVHCRGWEDVHRAIKRFIKFRLVKETNIAENELNEPPTIWNRELVDWVEEWSEFLDNFLNDPPIYRTYRQDVRKNETVVVKVGETEVAEEKLNEAREVLQMVNKTDEILDGMTDEKKVPLLPYHIPRRREAKSFFNNLHGKSPKDELREASVSSSSIERRTPVKLRKIYKAKESDEENGDKKIESEGETKNNENYRANDGILNFAKSHNPDFWLGNQKVGGNWDCKRSSNNGDRCEEWASIHRAIRRYLAFLEIIEGKTMTDFREQELAKIALFPRLRPESDGNAMTINNKGWIARIWGKFMAKDDGQYMDIKEAMAKVEDAFNLHESDQLKEPMELMNKILLQRVAEWAEFYEQNSQTLDPSVEEAQSILTYVLVKTFEDKNRIMPQIDMKIVKAPPLPKQIATEKKADEEKEKREEMLQKWKEIEQKLREQMEIYGNEAYTTRLKGAKTNAPNQLVIVYYNFFGFKRHRAVLIPSAAEIVHTVYVVKNGDNSYGMFGSNVFEAWKKAAKCVEIVQNGQIYTGGKECKIEIEAESRAEMFRKWTNLGKALQYKIGALYKVRR
uniref:Gag_pre-integrs domain-containing protein n=1 Tax=Globodera pallida TaxID=36090 RepID=A0A183BQL7_GLOPA